jgi:hypothetical protein
VEIKGFDDSHPLGEHKGKEGLPGYGSSDEKKMEWMKRVGMSGFSVNTCPRCKQPNLIVTTYLDNIPSESKCNNCKYTAKGGKSD